MFPTSEHLSDIPDLNMLGIIMIGNKAWIKGFAPASSASRFARTVRRAGFSRPPRLSFTAPLLSRNPIN